MNTLHTFGCSITQGFALPDVVRTLVDDAGRPLSLSELIESGVHWEDIHIYQPSRYAWPAELARMLDMPVVNHARRGACFQQIARQCAVAVKDIKPTDTVIVMWTYLSRLSMQWPARTSVPFCNVVDTTVGWHTVILGFNKLFGLSRAKSATQATDKKIHDYIHNYTRNTYLDPKGIYNHCYNNLVLQIMTHGFLAATGARVIHLSVEPDAYTLQLELARQGLEDSLREPQVIPHPDSWYNISVDHDSARIIHDPTIPPAANDMHPSVEHHQNFARHIYDKYFAL